MILFACSVKDVVAGTFQAPFFVPALGVGVRWFTDEVNRVAQDNMLYVHSGDFELYRVGDFETMSGRMSDGGCDYPELLVKGSAVKSDD